MAAGGHTVKDARRLLEGRGHKPDQILWTDLDSIGFTEQRKGFYPGGRPLGLIARTAWLTYHNGKLVVAIEDGFQHEPGLVALTILDPKEAV